MKLAAAEGLLERRAGAPPGIGGWPDVDARRIRYALEVPAGLSLLAFHDPRAEVQGLDRAPRDEWPNVAAVHLSFQIMVGLGTYLAVVALWVGWLAWRKADLAHVTWLMRALAVGTPFGFLAIEAGRGAAQPGRPPWGGYGGMCRGHAAAPKGRGILP